MGIRYTMGLEAAEEGGYTARFLEALENIKAIEPVLEVTGEQSRVLGEIG